MSLQGKVNTDLIGVDWKEKEFNWHIAAAMEVAELIESSYKYKWWTPQQIKTPFQNALEITDIFAFLVSWAMRENYTPREISLVLESRDCDLNAWSFLRELSQCNRAIESLEFFSCLLGYFDLRIVDLVRIHAAKSALNIVRRDYNYNSNKYRKLWEGFEDNIWLERFYAEASYVATENLYAAMYNKLEDKYLEIVE